MKSVIAVALGSNVIKLFYGRNLQIFVISYGACPWLAFTAYSNV
jgi:hypothetical protein